MFILSIKSFKRKALILSIILFFIFLISFAFLKSKTSNYTTATQTGQYSLVAKTNEDRIKFLSQFGWEVEPDPIEICEIKIPSKFNEVYENYNSMQKDQGLDLSKYKEQNCTRYTYQVLNYKDAPGGIRANILVFNNKVIGGDICSIEIDGFMHGFSAPENYKPAYNSYNAKIVNTSPKGFPDGPIKSTYKENLDPDPNNKREPTD